MGVVIVVVAGWLAGTEYSLGHEILHFVPLNAKKKERREKREGERFILIYFSFSLFLCLKTFVVDPYFARSLAPSLHPLLLSHQHRYVVCGVCTTFITYKPALLFLICNYVHLVFM